MLPSRSPRWRPRSAPNPTDISARIRRLAGDRRLAELGADRRCIDAVVEGAMARPELSRMTPGEVERSDLVAIIEAAW